MQLIPKNKSDLIVIDKNSSNANGISITQQDIGDITCTLMELYYSKDPHAKSRGKANDGGELYDRVGFKTSNGTPARIQYKVLKSGKKRIIICKIYKKSQKHLQ